MRDLNTCILNHMLKFDTDWLNMKKGNKEAFLRIFELHYSTLFTYGFCITSDRELTKDCIQEMFLELWDTKETVNGNIQNVKSYLFTWLRRKIIRFQLKFKDRASHFNKDFFQCIEVSYEDLLIAFQENEERKEKLQRALKRLTKKQLELIRLKFFENLSYSEISAKTALQPRTVYNTIYTAIVKLREEIYTAQNV